MQKKSSEELTDTYSAVMRQITKNNPEKVKDFMKAFKESFDKSMDEDLDNHQDIALLEAKKVLACDNFRFVKLAQVAMGTSNNPNDVGKTLANILRVLLSRMPHKDKVYKNMREKILNMNVSEISGTLLPSTAAYGQSLTLIKTLLNGYNPEFVKKVLINTTKYLY